MEKDRSSKVLAIVALLIGVVGLSLGFAAFSRTLTIEPKATVTGNENDFSVVFSTSATSLVTGNVAPTASVGATGDDAILDETLISNLHARFTAPGQQVQYRFYAYNNGDLDAYLNSISYGKTNPECKAVGTNGATPAYVEAACNAITVTVEVGDSDTTKETVTGTKLTIDNHKLTTTKKAELVTVTIDYPSTATKVDGDFTIEFGEILLNYSSAD